MGKTCRNAPFRLLKTIILIALTGGLSGCATSASNTTSAGSQLANIDQSAPLTLRRQTLIVRNIENSLQLYRDAIGMEIIYDNIITRPHKTEDRDENLRLVFLKASHDFVGVLGLLEYEYENFSHESKKKPVRKEGFSAGNSVVLFNTTELEKRWPLIEQVPGVEIIHGPKYTEYPSYDGTEVIRINVTSFYDPDGFLVEYNQPLDNIF